VEAFLDTLVENVKVSPFRAFFLYFQFTQDHLLTLACFSSYAGDRSIECRSVCIKLPANDVIDCTILKSPFKMLKYSKEFFTNFLKVKKIYLFSLMNLFVHT